MIIPIKIIQFSSSFRYKCAYNQCDIVARFRGELWTSRERSSSHDGNTCSRARSTVTNGRYVVPLIDSKFSVPDHLLSRKEIVGEPCSSKNVWARLSLIDFAYWSMKSHSVVRIIELFSYRLLTKLQQILSNVSRISFPRISTHI